MKPLSITRREHALEQITPEIVLITYPDGSQRRVIAKLEADGSNADLIIRNAGTEIAYNYRPRGMETR